MHFDDILNCVGIIAKYLLPTLKVFFFTLLFSIPLGMIVALIKKCPFKPVSWLINLYILIMRGTPLMLQIITIYYAIPMLQKAGHLTGIDIRSDSYQFTALIVAFALNYAAYFAEIFRGGIEAIPKGQHEASAALGFTKMQTFFRIILPQVIKRIVPPIGNEIITLVKDTSLVRVIAVYEIMWNGERFIKQGIIWPLFFTGVYYLLFSGILTVLLGKLEKKLDYFKV